MTDHNPYATPASAVHAADPVRKGSPLKAVLMGLLVDIGGSLGAGVVVGAGYSLLLAAGGAPADEITRRLNAILPGTPLHTALTALGALLSFLGGYVCARIVRRNELRVAGVMAFFSGGFSLLMGREDALLYTLGNVLLVLVAILAGAALARRRNRSEEAGLGRTGAGPS